MKVSFNVVFGLALLVLVWIVVLIALSNWPRLKS